MAQEWFCFVDGKLRGPLGARNLRHMAEYGQLRPTDQVRRGIDGKWFPASSFKGLTFGNLSVALPEPPPPAPEPSYPPVGMPFAGKSTANPSAEVEYLNSHLALVTNTRAVLNGVTYAMANVTSVRMHKVSPDETPATIAAFSGLILAIGGGAIYASGTSQVGALALAGGLALFAGGIIWIFANLKPTWVVVLGSAGGERQAMTSLARQDIEPIVDAITQAIVSRG